MKITKRQLERQLARIIKEENTRILAEQADTRMAVDEDLERLLPDSPEATTIRQIGKGLGVDIEVRTVGTKEALLAFYEDLQAGGESINFEALMSLMKPAYDVPQTS